MDIIGILTDFKPLTEQQKKNITTLMQQLRISEKEIKQTLEHYDTEMYANIIGELKQHLEKFKEKRQEIIKKYECYLKENPYFFIDKYGKKLNDMNFKELKKIL